MVDGTKKWGIGEKVPIDLPAPAASSFGEVADFTDQLPLLAIGGFGQGSDHDGAVAHGDGRQHHRQRRRDDEAARRRRARSTTAATC